MKELLGDIDHILRHTPEDGIGESLRLEGINSIRDATRGVLHLPEGSPLRILNERLQILLAKNGSTTTIDKTRIRCIGALGLIHRRYGHEYPREISNVVGWLYRITVSPTEQTTLLISRRVGYRLEEDRIVGE